MTRVWHRPSWFALALLLVGVALFVRLGLWQLDRMQQKRSILDAATAAIAERRPAPLSKTAYDASRTHDYDWTEGTGAFAGSDPILLDDQVRNGQAGLRVYRVFYMDKPDWSLGGNLLVDLGWVPWPPNRQLPDLKFPVTNRIDVRGLLSPPPSSGIPLGPGFVRQSHAWLATRIDTAALAPQILAWTPNFTPPLAPRVLRLDPALPIGFERDLDVLPNTMPPERHAAYAFQWFALAVAALAIFIVRHWRKVDNAKK
jgi:cytochrome oxidase assembly protein ShyY1